MKVVRILVLLTLLSFPAFGDEMSPNPAWQIRGDFSEVCTCNAPCPCWFGGKPTRLTCGKGQVVFVEKGTFGKVKLDGLAFARFTESPEGKTMNEGIGNYRFDYVYISEIPDPRQREALEAIALQMFPSTGPARQVQYVQFYRKKEEDKHRISIGTGISIVAQLLRGPDGITRIQNLPLGSPVHRDLQQGETIQYTYRDDERNWSLQHSNYTYAPIEIGSDRYK